MKRIMTIVIAAAMMLIGTNASAQFSASVGYTNSQTKFRVAGFNVAKPSMNGVYAGLTYNIPVADAGIGTVGVAPGLYFAYLMKPETNLYVVKGNISESYLDVPVDFNFTMPVADGIKFILFAGPTFSVGTTSNINVTTVANKDISDSIIGSKNDLYDGLISQYFNYQRFDVLLGGGIGLDFEDMIRVTIGYDAGMLNRGGNTVNIRRNQLHIGLAYLF